MKSKNHKFTRLIIQWVNLRKRGKRGNRIVRALTELLNDISPVYVEEQQYGEECYEGYGGWPYPW